MPLYCAACGMDLWSFWAAHSLQQFVSLPHSQAWQVASRTCCSSYMGAPTSLTGSLSPSCCWGPPALARPRCCRAWRASWQRG